MKISLEEARETALLARLELTGEELARLTRELDAILVYVEKLSELDVTNVAPTTHAVPLDCPLREDVVGPQLDPEQALADAPRRQETLFEVPKIIEVGE